MEERRIKAGDAIRRDTGELLYVHAEGLLYFYASLIEDGVLIAIPRRSIHKGYELANEEVEAAAQESCTTDCLQYRQGVCRYLGN
ncbi:MAG: hypothetical protein II275_12230, partial [Bacteroidaceae bacterium]|nr:hypothetical protein [Bacteroidaceae bacterium]